MIPFADLSRLRDEYSPVMKSAMEQTIQTGFLVGGPLVEKFEREFSEYVGVEQTIGVGNGLDAIQLALEAWEIGPGDEVIVPAYTFYASWLAVVKTGATLVPVDVKSSDATLDPELITAQITPKTRAILTVHLFGHASDMISILQIAREYGLWVLEDVAQAHGGSIKSQMLGSMGDAGAFSFYPTKNLGAIGDAGAVTTSNHTIASIIRSKRSYGSTTDKFTFETVGMNSRLDPLQAAFLSEKLRSLEATNLRRKEVAARYCMALKSRAGRVIRPDDLMASVWHLFVVQARDRSHFINSLKAAGVCTDLHYPYWIGQVATLKTHLRGGLVASDFPNSRRLARSVVSVPLGPWVSSKEVESIEAALADI